jgi:hypothetical protein
LYDVRDVQALATEYENAIKDVVGTCLSKEEVIKTPSDYGIDISVETLKNISGILRGAKK